MGRLHEWKDINGKKVSTTSTAPQVAGTSGQITSGSFKKRLNKLINYYGQHHPAKVDFITVNLLTNDTLDFTEYHNDRSAVSYKIYIGPATEAWRLQVSKNNKYTDDLSGIGWANLLRELRSYITVPVVSTPEYKSLLTEWLDSNGKKVSLSTSTSSQPTPTTSSNTFYKDKFKKLLDYHMANASYALSKNIDRLSEDDSKASFSYVEEFKNSKGKVCEILVGVRYYKDTEAWSVKVWIDGHQVVDKEGITFNSLIADLKDRLVLPSATSSEYKDLCESYSLADDFKLYENLWEDEGKRFRVIMVVDDEEYPYGTYDSRNRANEIAMKVREERGVDTFVEEV